MKKKQVLFAGSIIAAAAAVIILFVLFRGPGKPEPGHDRAGPPAPAATAQEAVPDQTDEAPTVEIQPEMQGLMGVKTAAVEIRDMARTIRAAGRVAYDEQRLSTVNAKVDGWIVKLHADIEGSYLKKGEPVLSLYSPELLSAQQELISLLASRPAGWKAGDDSLAASDWQRLTEAARKRLRLWDISDVQIREIERTGRPVKALTIASPVSGYVMKRYVTRGVRVMPGEPLLDIADLSQVWVVAEVSGQDIGAVKAGMPVRITVSGLPGRSFPAGLDYVYPSLDARTRTLKVRASLKNPGDHLKPQMYATVEITADLGRRLAVPSDSVMDTGERTLVYVDRGEGSFEPRVVTAGIQADGMREITSGLKPGERVATSALFLIDSEAQLKGVAPASPMAPAQTQDRAAPGPAGHQH